MMKKIFDKGILKKTIGELFYMGILLIFFGFMIIIFGKEFIVNYWSMAADISVTYNIISTAMVSISIFGSFAMSAIAFSFAWNKKKADFEYSLPVTKGALFVSKVSGIIVSISVIDAIIAVFGVALMWGMLGRFIFISDVLLGLANSVICALLIVGAVSIAVSITGKRLSAAIFSLGIFTIPFLVPVIKYYAILRITNGYFWDELFVFLRRSLYLPTNVLVSQTHLIDFNGYLPGILFSLALAIAYLAAGYFLFRRRSGDMTGSHSKSKAVHYIIMALIPFAILNIASVSLLDYGVFSIFSKSRYIYEMITYIVSSLILMFVYDVIVFRRLRKNNRIIWIFIPLAIAAYLLNLAVHSSVLNQKEMEISSDDVVSVNMFTYEEVFSPAIVVDRLPCGIKLASEVDITDREIINEIVKSYNQSDDKGQYSYEILVKLNLKGGRKEYVFVPFEDKYDFLEHEMRDNLLADIKAIPEMSEAFYSIIPSESVLTISNSYELVDKDLEKDLEGVYEVFEAEYNALTDEEKTFPNEWLNYTSSEWYENYANINIVGHLYLRGRVSGTNVADTYYLTFEYTPEASLKYTKAVNTANLDEAKAVVWGVETGAMNNIVKITLTFHNTGDSAEEPLTFGRGDELSREYFFKVIDIIKQNGFKEPEEVSIILEIDYYDTNSSAYKTVYLSVTEDEMKELTGIYNKWQQNKD